MAFGKEAGQINLPSQVPKAAADEEAAKKRREKFLAALGGAAGTVVAASNDAAKNVPSDLAPSPFLDSYLAARRAALNRIVGG